jgi:hypothetical protein
VKSMPANRTRALARSTRGEPSATVTREDIAL